MTTKQYTGPTRPPTLDEATSAIRAWYYNEIREMAQDYVERLKAGEFGTGEDAREALDEAMHEDVDGSQLVIYTHQAKAVLFASDNEDAYEEETGESAPAIEAAAYMAIRADLREAFDGLDIDVNDPNPELDEEDEEASA